MWAMRNNLGKNRQYKRDIYDDNFIQMGSYMYCDHNVDFGGDLGNIKLKILIFLGKNDSKVYLKQEKNMEWIFQYNNYPELKKVKLIVISFTDYHCMAGSISDKL